MNTSGIFATFPVQRFKIFLVSLAAIVSLLFAFSWEIRYNTTVLMRFVIYTGDAVLLLAPLWVLGRRGCRAVIEAFWILALLLAVSLWYYRYWGDLMPYSSLLNLSVYNPTVFRSGLHMLQWRDLHFLLIPAAASVAVWRLTRRPFAAEWGRGRRWLAVALSVLLYLVIYALVSWRISVTATNEVGQHQPFADVLGNRLKNNVRLEYVWQSNSWIAYNAVQFRYLLFPRRISYLSQEQRDDIDAFISIPRVAGTHPDGRGKNLILIIVESLDAPYVGLRIGDRQLTPVLDSIIADPHTLAALAMKHQIGIGGSSDGQLMYNTGLYPMPVAATCFQFGDNHYCSLANSAAFARKEEFIVEDASMWNHAGTNKSFGYDAISDADSLKNSPFKVEEIGMDAAVFAYALQHMKVMPQPFFCQVTTMSMHHPFNDPAVKRQPWIDEAEGYEPLRLDYMQMLHFFDRQLGHFIAGLKAEGLYDNSVIAVISDHASTYEDTNPIAFFLLNAGIEGRVEKEVRQIDVFPTLLDAMGAAPAFQGVGVSLYREDYDSLRRAIPEEEMHRISELIIRSDYFRED